MSFVIAYDLGISSLKASIIDEKMNIIADAVQSYQTHSMENGMREQNPLDWEKALVLTTKKLLQEFPFTEKIEGIGISGHSLGVVAIDENNQLLTDRTPIWSDSRAKKQADAFFDIVDYEEWYNRTGNGFTRQLYSIFKIMWYKENHPEIYQKAKTFLGTKDWLNMRLCNAVCTDHSYASGSGVYDLSANTYHYEYIKAANLIPTDFPPIVLSTQVVGTLTLEASSLLGLPQNVKVVSGGVDNACMSLGAGCFENQDAYVSLGSSAWIATSTDKPVTSFEKKDLHLGSLCTEYVHSVFGYFFCRHISRVGN